MNPRGVLYQIDVVYDTLDDFAEGKGNDGKVVAFEPKNRDSDEDSGNRRHGSSKQDRQRESHPNRSKAFLSQHTESASHESAQAHEARVSQA